MVKPELYGCKTVAQSDVGQEDVIFKPFGGLSITGAIFYVSLKKVGLLCHANMSPGKDRTLLCQYGSSSRIDIVNTKKQGKAGIVLDLSVAKPGSNLNGPMAP